jgi:hypothetical protein
MATLSKNFTFHFFLTLSIFTWLTIFGPFPALFPYLSMVLFPVTSSASFILFLEKIKS